MIWRWTLKLMPLMSQDPRQCCQITITQAFIGERTDFSLAIPKKWWDALWFTTLWHIWLARIKETIPKVKDAHIVTTRKIWHQVKLYLKVGWCRCKDQVKSSLLTVDVVEYKFWEDFWENSTIVRVQEGKLWVIDFPNELDSRATLLGVGRVGYLGELIVPCVGPRRSQTRVVSCMSWGSPL